MSDTTTQAPPPDIRPVIDNANPDPAVLLSLRERCLVDREYRKALDRAMEGLPSAFDQPGLTVAPIRTKGFAWFLMGEDRRAAEWLERGGDSRSTRYVLGLALLGSGRFAAAAKTLSTVESEFPASRFAQAEALLRSGDADGARKVLNKCTTEQRASSEGKYLASHIAELQGDYQNAYNGYGEVLAAEPDHPRALFRLAYMNDLDGNEDEAVRLYERLRERQPTFANALVNLGVLYEDRGEYTKAVDAYRKILGIDPNHPRARRFFQDARASLNMYYDEDLERTEDRRAQILRIPISDFELSVRSRNCLSKMQIETLGDLIRRTEPELLSYKNFGETSLQEIKDILAQKGLRLGMGREEQTASVQAAARTLLGIEPERGDILTKKIEDLELSVRSKNAMSMLGVETLGDLTRLSEKDLMEVKNFGQTSMNEVKEKLAEFGLSLAESIE
ncbi:MAG: tetratricopeptide repeat protein [Planctomycetes bacterium]|jgi:DNA-directed RNA polymerase subunit alpha|nr:tetratricopeptide repeat protein [Planctomycetota bacterium]